MMNRPIDATVIRAVPKRGTLGERVYTGVMLLRRDGYEVSLGQVRVSARLGDVLTPGREGRFSFHDVLGAQGLHAFAAPGEATRIAFPMLLERSFAALALLNLLLVSLWLAQEQGLPLVPLMLGVAATAAWATCRGCREAVLHDLRFEGRVAAASSHRRAVMRGHA